MGFDAFGSAMSGGSASPANPLFESSGLQSGSPRTEVSSCPGPGLRSYNLGMMGCYSLNEWLESLLVTAIGIRPFRFDFFSSTCTHVHKHEHCTSVKRVLFVHLCILTKNQSKLSEFWL